MATHTQLTAQWHDWIVENLARGCAVQALVEDMCRSGFDATFAHAAVEALARGEQPPAARPLKAQTIAYVADAPRLPAGNVIPTHDRDVRVLLRVAAPTIAVLDQVLSDEECDELIRRSADKLQRSTTVDPVNGGYEVIAARSSEGTFFPVNADDFIARLDRRIAELMNCPVENGEGLQVLHYGEGGEYQPHFDYFSPGDPGSEAQMAVGGQRVSTLLIYLNDVAQGGATVFPTLGLRVLPKKGMAVYFEYSNRAGQVDPLTLHGGEPVEKGEKWIITKWMRQRSYGLAAPAEP
ncbi:proline dioxygenase [Rhodanobacter sp. Root627]|uniref:2OG-Fe(II) oxygenase n=1 Tax=Rhodanobacter sp. Root627 TaxID=1736572 RepID=UPI0006F336AB|nr:2OG-Fe(II) oxygenase [Rhodanobacter sp. Root627]KRA33696.1 proline dioxygenase [Rhodanobacter sp. Root627]